MITLDTAGVLAVSNRGDPDHPRARAALARERRPFLVPAGILSEVAYMMERNLGLRVLRLFIGNLIAGDYQISCGDGDLPRVDVLVARYADLPLGMADAMVIACAERHGGRVLTFDHRHVGVVAREGTITVVP